MTYKVSYILPRDRYLIEGDFKDLHVGDKVEIEWDDESTAFAVVETRTTAGVVVKTI